MRIFWPRALLVIAVLSSCGGAQLNKGSKPGDSEEGLAVFYSDNLQGRKTASGERYDKEKLTAAHRHLPFQTIVRVVNLKNRRAVTVRINDRGPFGSSDRVIDVSREAARHLEMIRSGMVRVRVQVVSCPD